MSSAPYKLSGLNVAYAQGQADRRAGRPAQRTNDMSTFYAAAYLRGYKGQAGHRSACGHLQFSALAGDGAERRVFGTLGVRHTTSRVRGSYCLPSSPRLRVAVSSEGVRHSARSSQRFI
jgi:hypothetical protein